MIISDNIVYEGLKGMGKADNIKITKALKKLDEKREQYFNREALAMYSPKFLNMYENTIQSNNNKSMAVLGELIKLKIDWFIQLKLLWN